MPSLPECLSFLTDGGAAKVIVDGSSDGNGEPVGEEVPGGEEAAEEEDAGEGEAEGVECGGMIELEELDGSGDGSSKRCNRKESPGREQSGKDPVDHQSPESGTAVFDEERREAQGKEADR